MKDPAALPASPGPFDDLLAAPLASAPGVEPGQRLPDPFADPPAPPQPAPAHPPPVSASDPFADLLGAPIAGQMAQVPSPQRTPTSALIPDDFDPMTLAAVSARNPDNPLQALNADDVNTIFAQPSVDAIYAPQDTSIAPMIEDPLAAGHHGGLVDVDSPLDPLLLFGGNEGSGSILDISAASQTPPPAAPVHNHTPERSAFFRAPAPTEPPLPETTPAVAPAQESPPVLPDPAPAVLDAPPLPDPSLALPAALPRQEQGPADARQLLDAFAHGARLGSSRHLDILSPELMHTFGQFFALTMQGMRLLREIEATAPELQSTSILKQDNIHDKI